jgi:hypothetical protein
MSNLCVSVGNTVAENQFRAEGMKHSIITLIATLYLVARFNQFSYLLEHFMPRLPP